jgi:hypothetical protein
MLQSLETLIDLEIDKFTDFYDDSDEIDALVLDIRDHPHTHLNSTRPFIRKMANLVLQRDQVVHNMNSTSNYDEVKTNVSEMKMTLRDVTVEMEKEALAFKQTFKIHEDSLPVNHLSVVYKPKLINPYTVNQSRFPDQTPEQMSRYKQCPFSVKHKPAEVVHDDNQLEYEVDSNPKK